MAEGFIGLSVLATLRHPPDAKVRGMVTKVIAGELTLNKGMLHTRGSDFGGFANCVVQSHGSMMERGQSHS